MTIPHALGLEEAKRRISDFVARKKERTDSRFTDLEQSNNGQIESFKFRAMGFSVGGWFKIQPAELLVEISFPLAALPFKGLVEKEIRSQAEAILAAG